MPKQNKRGYSTAGLIIAIFFIVAVQSTLFIQVISISGSALKTRMLPFFPTDPWQVILFIILPIIYCSIVSLLIHPKQIVSPIYVQIGTLAVVTLMIANNLANAEGFIPRSGESVANFSLSLFASFALFLAFGFVQLLIVKWLVSLNLEKTNRVSYSVDVSLKEILKKLNDLFLDTWDLSRECDVKNIWLFRRSDEKSCHVIIEIGSIENKKSIIATVAFGIESDTIIESNRASILRDKIVEDMEKLIERDFSKNHISLDDTVSRLAYSHVEDMARSKIGITWGFLKRLSRFYQIMIGITVFALASLFAMYFFRIIDTGTYIGVTVALAIGLLIEMGIPLRDEVARKKREVLDFN